MKVVNILGINYSIELVTVKELFSIFESNANDLKELTNIVGENGEGFAGLCQTRSCRIWINKEMKDEKVEKVVFHEIMEAMKAETQTDMTHEALQAIVNALWCSGLVSVKDLVKNGVEEININID